MLALFKLANVCLAMLWGFVVTFVFVRVLPIAEFRAFLLLVAFANFTISADFGFSGILYARLRRFRLRANEATGIADFRPQDVAMLFAFMATVVLLGGAIIAAGIATGHIPTAHPGLFLAFYLLTTTNIFALLTRRALAALDHNLLWDAVDALRRCLSVGLLLLALAGLSILVSVIVQIVLAVVALLFGLSVVHRATGMRARDWLLRGAGGGSPLRVYMRDMGATMALTLSDVAAYNAPYFGIAIATHDPRPLLVFDFVFKMSRALSAVIRALVEALLPRLTAAFHAAQFDRAEALVRRALVLALGAAGALALVLILSGGPLSSLLFNGKAVLDGTELGLLAVLLGGLALLCVSTYVHNGVGRFGVLLPPSFAFLAISALSVPLGLWVAHAIGQPFVVGFLGLYAFGHVLLGLRHLQMVRQVARA